MKLKLDDNGHAALKDGFPVWAADDGKEIAYSVPELIGKLSAVNAESAGRRKDIENLSAKLGAFEGIDPEKARAALDALANLDAGKLMEAGDKLSAKDASIRNLLVKGVFDSSAFLKDRTVLPPDVAYASFGDNLEAIAKGEVTVAAR